MPCEHAQLSFINLLCASSQECAEHKLQKVMEELHAILSEDDQQLLPAIQGFISQHTVHTIRTNGSVELGVAMELP